MGEKEGKKKVLARKTRVGKKGGWGIKRRWMGMGDDACLFAFHPPPLLRAGVGVCGTERPFFPVASSPPIRGHQKNRRKGGTKNRDWVGVKIWLQGGGQLHETGRGQGGGTLEKTAEKISLGQKLAFFKTLQESGKC